MRRRGGEDLDLAAAREVGEGTDEVAAEPLDERLLEAGVRAAVELGDGLLRRCARDAEVPRVELGTTDLVVGVRDETSSDVRVGELLEERGGEPDRDSIR